MKKLSIVSGCYNESGNVAELVDRVAKLMANLWECEHELFQVSSSSLLWFGPRRVFISLQSWRHSVVFLKKERINLNQYRLGVYAW